MVNDYNKHIDHVDKSDMYKSCYEIDRKSKKWWHRIFWHFVDLTIVNTFIIFKERQTTASRTLSLKEFRLAVANGLIGVSPEVPEKGRRTISEVINKYKVHVPLEIRTDKAVHMPIHGAKVRCANYSTQDQPHRTRWHCFFVLWDLIYMLRRSASQLSIRSVNLLVYLLGIILLHLLGIERIN